MTSSPTVSPRSLEALEFPQTLALLARRDLSPMISHRFPLAHFTQALTVARDPQQAGKVMVEPGSPA